MELLCLGDIAIIRNISSFPKWKKHDCMSTGEDNKILFNWELPVGTHMNTSARTSGSRFTSSLNSIEVIQNWAPGIATLATNHTLDAGAEGLSTTISKLKNSGFEIVGAGMTLKETNSPLIWETKEGRLAIFNWVFPETHPDVNAIPGPNCWPGIQNAQNQILNIRNQVDWVLLVLHWGDELFPYPSPQHREIAGDLARCGVDAIVGHHPHVVRGMEFIGGCPIFYSLGNYFFNVSGKNAGSSNSHRAPRNNEALGVKWVFKRGEKTGFLTYSSWAKSVEVIPDSKKRAERRLSETSQPLQRYHGQKYLEWYDRKKNIFFNWEVKWYFGVLGIGVKGFFPYIFRKIRLNK